MKPCGYPWYRRFVRLPHCTPPVTSYTHGKISRAPLDHTCPVTICTTAIPPSAMPRYMRRGSGLSVVMQVMPDGQGDAIFLRGSAVWIFQKRRCWPVEAIRSIAFSGHMTVKHAVNAIHNECRKRSSAANDWDYSLCAVTSAIDITL